MNTYARHLAARSNLRQRHYAPETERHLDEANKAFKTEWLKINHITVPQR